MSTFLIEIGFDRKGVRTVERHNKIFLPCGVTRLQGADPTILASRCHFKQHNQVRLRVFDITSLIAHDEPEAKEPRVPAELRLDFQRSRSRQHQDDRSPISQDRLCLRNFGRKGMQESIIFGKSLPAWDVEEDSDSCEPLHLNLINTGGFLVTYHFRLKEVGAPLADCDCPAFTDYKKFEYVHDPEWIVGGGTGP